MPTLRLYNLPNLCGLMLLLTIIALIINHFLFQFPGNNFFPEQMTFLSLSLVLINLGLVIFFGKTSRACRYGIELIYFFSIMVLITFATNAIQYTPFPPIDQYIVHFEQYVGIDTRTILSWTNSHPQIKNILAFIYDSLPYQMSFIPLIVIVSGKLHVLRGYYFLLLSTTLLGFIIYYFFPTTAPASIIQSPYFSAYQLATGLKFNQIHHYIVPTTNEGGLIAFPSFHTIWALLGVYLLKDWPIAALSLFLFNLLLIASCVLLGWHYVSDLILGMVLVGICYWWLRSIKVELDY